MFDVVTQESVELDTVRRLCRDQRWYVALAVLTEQERQLTVNDLTKAIVRHDHDAPITEADTDVVAEIQDELIEEQIPALTDAGIVEYDRERELVEPTVESDRLQAHLEVVEDDDSALELPADLRFSADR